MLDAQTTGKIEGLASTCDRLTAIDIVQSAKEFIEEYEGDMKNIKQNSTWLRLLKANDIKTGISPRELDNLELSNKYGVNLNFGIVWDEVKGVKVQTESLGKCSKNIQAIHIL